MTLSTLTDIYWLAGILEGGGCLEVSTCRGINRTRTVLKIRVSMSDRDIVERCHAIARVGTVYKTKSRVGRKDIYVWQVSNQKNTAALMMTVYSIMGTRRQQKIQECLTAWRQYKGQQ
jgi:hypothetical protein